jgi:hypothetical protein
MTSPYSYFMVMALEHINMEGELPMAAFVLTLSALKASLYLRLIFDVQRRQNDAYSAESTV